MTYQKYWGRLSSWRSQTWCVRGVVTWVRRALLCPLLRRSGWTQFAIATYLWTTLSSSSRIRPLPHIAGTVRCPSQKHNLKEAYETCSSWYRWLSFRGVCWTGLSRPYLQVRSDLLTALDRILTSLLCSCYYAVFALCLGSWLTGFFFVNILVWWGSALLILWSFFLLGWNLFFSIFFITRNSIIVVFECGNYSTPSWCFLTALLPAALSYFLTLLSGEALCWGLAGFSTT